MLKSDQLREFRPVFKYTKGDDITLDNLENALISKASDFGVPLLIQRDQIKSGTLFKPEVNDCLVMLHPEHQKDYYRIAVTIKHQGKIAFIQCNDFGESKNLKKLAYRENAKANAKSGAKFAIFNAENGADMVGALGVMAKGAVGGLLSLGGSKNKQEQENMYYDALMSILDEIVY